MLLDFSLRSSSLPDFVQYNLFDLLNEILTIRSTNYQSKVYLESEEAILSTKSHLIQDPTNKINLYCGQTLISIGRFYYI